MRKNIFYFSYSHWLIYFFDSESLSHFSFFFKQKKKLTVMVASENTFFSTLSLQGESKKLDKH